MKGNEKRAIATLDKLNVHVLRSGACYEDAMQYSFSHLSPELSITPLHVDKNVRYKHCLSVITRTY